MVTKQSVHSFPDKKSALCCVQLSNAALTTSDILYTDPGGERFKTTFTIRDSPSDYINATCWGSEDFIRGLHASFKICDVGKRVCSSFHDIVPVCVMVYNYVFPQFSCQMHKY